MTFAPLIGALGLYPASVGRDSITFPGTKGFVLWLLPLLLLISR